ncbi:MAG: archaeosortase/exosortase family protein [Bryobacteraceae bacterium]|nr:archaeosortase/exosortase family protein [Bryobacteraceae bacterium]
MSSPTTLASTPAAARPLPWKAIAWFTILLLVLFAQVFAGLIREWGSDEDMGHGFFVIPVALYVTWQKRDELLAIKPQPSPWGYLFILGGFLFLLAGVLGAEFFISRVGLLV